MRLHPERIIQAQVVHLLRSLGGVVYSLGVTRRKGDYQGTMQTPGLPDVIAFLDQGGGMMQLVIIELKAPGNTMTAPQRQFCALCEAAGVAHIVGGLDDVIAWLIENDYMKDRYTGVRRSERGPT